MLGAFGRSLLAGRSIVQQRSLSTFSANRAAFNPYPASEERSTSEERFSDDFDVVIVGGGPSGLSAAIRLKQLAGDKDLRIALVEKGASIGAHILSGAVMQPNGLTELIPDWKEKGAPVSVEAKEDYLFYFTETGKMTIPTWGTPLQNHGNYLISLGQLCAWLGEQAEELGVEVYPSIAGTEVLYEDKDGQETVVGIATGDSGIGKDGKRTPMFTEGMELRAKCTIFAEGCRGSLTKQLSEKLNLRADCQDPAFGIGLKELWEIPAEKHREGLVMHSMGWPAPSDVYGGSFMYHQANNKVAIGYVVGLDYKNPYYNPYKMFQQFKHHPYISEFLEGGTCLKYGARALSEGGLQSLPKLHFPGGALIGDTAGFLNVMKIKGIHNAIKSGMLCAESVFENLEKQEEGDVSPIHPASYEDKFKNSWLYQDIWEVRNVRPAFSNFGQVGGVLLSGVNGFLKGNLPFTLSHPEGDHEATGLAKDYKEIDYPKPDGKISFDLLTNVSRSGTNHNEDQPAHLRLRDSSIPVEHNLNKLGAPEERFCPAGVYEYVDDEEKGGKRLQINFSNCVHCKTCDIKDQKQNIDWTPPEGGNGPLYMEM